MNKSKANEQNQREAESQIQGLNKCLPEGREVKGMSEMAEGNYGYKLAVTQ